MAIQEIITKITTKGRTNEYFLAVEIGSETVTTAVWQIVGGQVEIVTTGTKEEWETEKEGIDKLLLALDTSLEKAMGGIDPEPSQVLYGLQESWVEGKSIARKYAKILKQITEKFAFEPIGFVVTAEAIVGLLKLQEGTPPNTILIRVSESELQINLVTLGEIVGTQTVGRSEDVGADVEEGLARFKTDDNFPSRMLLVNSNADLEGLKQDVLSYNWLEKLPFLHFPKVEVLEKDFAIKAIAIAGGSEAAKDLGFTVLKEPESEVEKPDKQPTSKAAIEGAPETVPTAEAIGFKEEADIVETTATGEVTQPEVKAPVETSNTHSPEPPEPTSQQWEGTRITIWHTLGEKLRSLSLSGLGLPKSLFRFDIGSRTRAIAALVFAALFLLTAGIGYAYWTVPKAHVVLYVRPRTFDKEVTITIDPQSSTIDQRERRIPGRIVETEIEEDRQTETTGTRLVGEKAKGEVTIYNKTSAPKTFTAGTQLVGPNNLAFTLDVESEVASASSQETEGAVTTTFGKARAAVTAVAIGAEYNLPAGSVFTFKNFSRASYDAKNESAMTGGSSREVQAISADDVQRLLSELQADLTKKAIDQLERDIGSGGRVLMEGAQVEEIARELSGEVGEEAPTLTVKLKLLITSLAYDEAEFKGMILEAVSDAIPEGYELRDEESLIEIRETISEESQTRAILVYKGVLSPRIDVEALRQELAGKYPDVGEAYLRSLPNFSHAEWNITPQFIPSRLKTFPRQTQKITIEVKVVKD